MGGGGGVESVTNSLITRHSNAAQTNVFHTITRLIILIPLQCHGDSERERERARGRKRERRKRFSETGMETGHRKEGGKAHQAKRSAVAVYFPMSS